jgi:serine/threonine protein kinase
MPITNINMSQTIQVLFDLLIIYSLEQDDQDDEAGRLRRKAVGKFILNDFKFLSTLGTGTFGRVRLVKHRSDPPEDEPLALKCLKKSEIIRLK